jgi:DNA-binding NarL/FixJ family response regulator
MDKPVNLSALGKCVHDVVTGKLSIEEESEVPIVVLDPEKRALEYFSKLLLADDVEIHTCKDEIDLRPIERVGVLVVEVMGLSSDNPCDFLREYKKGHPTTEILVTTAFHDDDMAKEMLEAGASKIITKPINPIPFGKNVREAVVRYQANRQREE